MDQLIIKIIVALLVLFSVVIMVNPSFFLSFNNLVLKMFNLRLEAIDGQFNGIRIIGALLTVLFLIIGFIINRGM